MLAGRRNAHICCAVSILVVFGSSVPKCGGASLTSSSSQAETRPSSKVEDTGEIRIPEAEARHSSGIAQERLEMDLTTFASRAMRCRQSFLRETAAAIARSDGHPVIGAGSHVDGQRAERLSEEDVAMNEVFAPLIRDPKLARSHVINNACVRSLFSQQLQLPSFDQKNDQPSWSTMRKGRQEQQDTSCIYCPGDSREHLAANLARCFTGTDIYCCACLYHGGLQLGQAVVEVMGFGGDNGNGGHPQSPDEPAHSSSNSTDQRMPPRNPTSTSRPGLISFLLNLFGIETASSGSGDSENGGNGGSNGRLAL